MSKTTPKGKPGDAGNALADDLSFEDALAQVESIIERIEAGEVGLEQSLVEYERGVGLVNLCRSKLDRAQQQIEDLTRKLDVPAGPDDKGGPGRSAGGGGGASGTPRVPAPDPAEGDQEPPF